MKNLVNRSFIAAALVSGLAFASPIVRREELPEGCEIEVYTTVYAVTTIHMSSSTAAPVVQPVTEVAPPAPTSTYVAPPPPSSTYVAPPPPSSTYVAPAPSSAAPQDVASSEPAGSATKNDAKTPTNSGLTPAGTKAGLSGYPGVQNQGGFSQLAQYISWYSDYTPTTPDSDNVQGIPMVWGTSSSCGNTGSSRMNDFQAMTTTPSIMFGFYEPDCDCPMSSDISNPSSGTAAWNELLAPLAKKGTLLGSPSMCKQKDEDWLTPFKNGLDADWDVTSIHVNKNSLAGVQEDVEYYAQKYGKPVWVTEFACVDDANGFTPCSDQGEIDSFLNDVVPYFQNNANVVAYGPSNGEGLGNTWPLFTSSGALSSTGQTYLNILKGL